jgi:hypothetical protein
LIERFRHRHHTMLTAHSLHFQYGSHLILLLNPSGVFIYIPP